MPLRTGFCTPVTVDCDCGAVVVWVDKSNPLDSVLIRVACKLCIYEHDMGVLVGKPKSRYEMQEMSTFKHLVYTRGIL